MREVAPPLLAHIIITFSFGIEIVRQSHPHVCTVTPLPCFLGTIILCQHCFGTEILSSAVPPTYVHCNPSPLFPWHHTIPCQGRVERKAGRCPVLQTFICKPFSRSLPRSLSCKPVYLDLYLNPCLLNLYLDCLLLAGIPKESCCTHALYQGTSTSAQNSWHSVPQCAVQAASIQC